MHSYSVHQFVMYFSFSYSSKRVSFDFHNNLHHFCCCIFLTLSFPNAFYFTHTTDTENERSTSNSISTTKYTVLSWLPISLMDQFKRVANVYFLLISVLMLIGKYAPTIFQTPLDPWSTIMTFIFVLGVTCIKEGNEDLKRAQNDRELTPEIFEGTIVFEPPNKSIYTFIGSFHNKASSNKNGLPLGPENVLLRSSLFSNTDWGYGIALYTGQETKIQMNNKRAEGKMSGIEKLANKAIILVFIAQCFLCTTTAVSVYALGFDKILPKFVELWFVFFLLFNNFIPISLYVTIELINVGQGMLINKDDTIYDEALNCATAVRSSNLAQELGMVSNIFSDKTGTLTCNEMRFVKFVIDDVMYDVEPARDAPRPADNLLGTHLPKNCFNFLRCLATCHTVIREKDGTYRAESPDELALVEGADKLNCSVKERGTVKMSTTMFGEDQQWEVLAINAFNSERKRMSLILKNDKGEYFMMCKGADNIMIPLCEMNNDKKSSVERHLLELAKLGLRTLVIGQKKLETAVAEAWLKDYSVAASAMEKRGELMDACAAKIEEGMDLLGITAIEDRLQDEVPETIASLAQAGIVVWMLTGDKEETAINIGRSCELVRPDSKLFMLCGLKSTEDTTGYKDPDTGNLITIVLVMDGPSFSFFNYDKPDQTKWFLYIGKAVRSVISCRLTPNQKQSATCLAIGDGANDVSMILEGDVGVGIFGKEGRQAANNADFAIGQFKFLKTLLLVHGRWNYVRQSQAFLYSLHKNAVITFMLFWYCYFTAVSGTSPFQSFVYSGYNLMLGMPAVFYGILDRDLSREFVEANPETYATGKDNVYLRGDAVVGWVVNALCYAVILCSIYYYAFANTFETYNMLVFGCIAYTGLVMALQCKMIFMHNQWAYPQVFFMAISIVGMIIYYYMVQYFSYDTFFGAVGYMYNDPIFWLMSMLTIPIITMLFEGICYYFTMFFNPTKEMLYREMQNKDKFCKDFLMSEHAAEHGSGIEMNHSGSDSGQLLF
eukprot:GSChrysophyteH2.ASY1.ANO1.1337.1 assembled CDS